MVHQGLGHSIPCSFIVISSQDTSRVTHEPISTGFREAIQGNTRQYKAIRSEREIDFDANGLFFGDFFSPPAG